MGNLILLRGCNIYSIASVISIGVVVKVNSDVIRINKKKRIEIAIPCRTPPTCILKLNISKSTAPSFVTIKCSVEVKIIRNQTGVKPFIIKRREILVEKTLNNAKIVNTAYLKKLFAKKTNNTKKNMIVIFVRGSKRWTIESP